MIKFRNIEQHFQLQLALIVKQSNRQVSLVQTAIQDSYLLCVLTYLLITSLWFGNPDIVASKTTTTFTPAATTTKGGLLQGSLLKNEDKETHRETYHVHQLCYE